jgi:hypothetical protein
LKESNMIIGNRFKFRNAVEISEERICLIK